MRGSPWNRQGLEEALHSTFNARKFVHQTVSHYHEANTPIPLVTRTPVISAACFTMYWIGAALMAMYFVAKARDGLWVTGKEWEGRAFGFVVTSILVAVSTYWKSVNIEHRHIQPCLNVALDNPNPKRTLLLDYVNPISARVLLSSFRNRDWIVLFSTLTAFLPLILPPFASVLFRDHHSTAVHYFPNGLPVQAGLRAPVDALRHYEGAITYLYHFIYDSWSIDRYIIWGWSLPLWAISESADKTWGAFQSADAFYDFDGIEAISSKLNCTRSQGVLTDEVVTTFQADFGSCLVEAQPDIGVTDNLQVNLTQGHGCRLDDEYNPLPPILVWATAVVNGSTPVSTAVLCQNRVFAHSVNARIYQESVGAVGLTVTDVTILQNDTRGVDLNADRVFDGLFWKETQDSSVEERTTLLRGQFVKYIKDFISEDVRWWRKDDSSWTNVDTVGSEYMVDIVASLLATYYQIAAERAFYIPGSSSFEVRFHEPKHAFLMSLPVTILLASCIWIVASVMLVIHWFHRKQRQAFPIYGPTWSIASQIALLNIKSLPELSQTDGPAELAAKFSEKDVFVERNSGKIHVSSGRKRSDESNEDLEDVADSKAIDSKLA